MRYHIYEDHDDLHVQIDSQCSVMIVEGEKEIEKLLAKLKEGLKKNYEISYKKKG